MILPITLEDVKDLLKQNGLKLYKVSNTNSNLGKSAELVLCEQLNNHDKQKGESK